MKLKHLFLSALVVGSLASCSKDDDGPNEPIYQQIETSLSISTTSNSGLVGKADTKTEPITTPGAESERRIKTLTAVVFYADGTFATTKTVTDPAQNKDFSTSIDDIIVKVAAIEAGKISTTELKVFLLANVSVPQSALASYDAFTTSSFSGITDYSFTEVMGNGKEGGKSLPMSSQELSVTNLLAGMDYANRVEKSGDVAKYTSNLAETKNKVLELSDGKYVPGDNNYKPSEKIALARYVARVQLESLEVDFGQNYEDAVFTLTSVSIANVSNASRFVEDNGGSLQSVDYTKDDAFYRGFPEKITRADYYLARSVYDQTVFSKIYGTIEGTTVKDGIKFGKEGEELVTFRDATVAESLGSNEMAQFYVFEFQGEKVTADPGVAKLPSTAYSTINTMLIITGFWDNGLIKEERSFRIPIRHDQSTVEDYQVKRNNIYKVHATLTGEGTKNPDKSMLNAFVSFSIDVEQWKVVKQTETDVN